MVVLVQPSSSSTRQLSLIFKVGDCFCDFGVCGRREEKGGLERGFESTKDKLTDESDETDEAAGDVGRFFFEEKDIACGFSDGGKGCCCWSACG